jgi:hypothetical protein
MALRYERHKSLLLGAVACAFRECGVLRDPADLLFGKPLSHFRLLLVGASSTTASD